MANLPSQHPTLSIHLSDITLTPLITSSSSPSHLDSLTALTSSALSSQIAAQRAHLGRPQRIMVEYPDSGAIVLQTYLDPRDSYTSSSSSAANNNVSRAEAEDADADADANGEAEGGTAAAPAPAPAGKDDSSEAVVRGRVDEHRQRHRQHQQSPEDAAPMLVGVIVAATSDDAGEARRAAARLERLGREFQKGWLAQADGSSTPAAAALDS
ncbi:hypothetical protein AAL_02618 [Moelleriella libera RCEF 2490]|uniref:Uncharacterized protein n=1 Tax=Moelleriella libera RCEF 2490 TaxID=1081109 RepID=A0A168ER88_9HYPO|nr:hypothetical protein AAL_02618 [Moelleriella libera RCEF 2490]